MVLGVIINHAASVVEAILGATSGESESEVSRATERKAICNQTQGHGTAGLNLTAKRDCQTLTSLFLVRVHSLLKSRCDSSLGVILAMVELELAASEAMQTFLQRQ